MSSPSTALPWWREPTRQQWTAYLAAWFGWVLDAFDFTVFLVVMPEIARAFGVSYVATASSLTLTLLLRLAGGFAAGWLGDRYGRRLPLILSIVWFALCDGAVAFAPSFGWVLVLRALFGFGMGAEWTAGATLAMESWPSRTRGLASGVLQGSWAVGYLLAGVVAAEVVPRYGWRAMFLIAAAPALLALPIRLWVNEPTFTPPPRDVPRPPLWQTLRTHRVVGRIAWASAVLALGFGGYYGMTSLYATLLKTELGMTGSQVATLVALFNVGMMLGAIGCGLLATRTGPAIAIGLPALLTLPVLPLYVGLGGLGSSWLALGVGALLGGAAGGGSSGVTPYLLHGLFPPELRARAIGLSYHLGAFAAAFVPPAVAASARSLGGHGWAIAGIVAACELAVVVVLVTRPRPA